MDIVASNPFKVAQVSDSETAMTNRNCNDIIQADLIKAYRLCRRSMTLIQKANHTCQDNSINMTVMVCE